MSLNSYSPLNSLLPLVKNPLCNPSCEACHLKEFEYPVQLQRKQAYAQKQLARWSSSLKQINPAPEGERLGYRKKSWMLSHFQEGEIHFGKFRSVRIEGVWQKEFISWDTCPIYMDALQTLNHRLKTILSRDYPEFARDSLVGLWTGNPHVVLICRDTSQEIVQKLDWEKILVPPFDQVWFHQHAHVGRRIFGPLPIELIFSRSKQSPYPIHSFRQVAQSLLTKAREEAVRALLQSQPGLILDLYCGDGALSLLLPDELSWVGVEMAKDAVAHAKTLRAFKEDRIHEAFVGTVEHRLKDPRVLSLIQKPFALFLNPPRSGLGSIAAESLTVFLQEQRPAAIVYLSCSVSSLRPDLELIEAQGYEVKHLQPYDFFPQTHHFETLAVLEYL